MSTTYKITGRDAVRIAQRENLTIHCHSNPIDDGGVVTAEVATQILKEDPRLIYVTVTPAGWRNAQGNHCDGEGRTVEAYFSGTPSMYLGPDDDGVEPCWNDSGMSQFTYATDSGCGKVEAASLEDAYEALRANITDEQVKDGATLSVCDPQTGESIRMTATGGVR